MLSLRAIRERANIVGEAAKAGNLTHFDVDQDRLDDVADYVASVIKARHLEFSDIITELNNFNSVTSALTSSTPSPLMAAGSISRWAMFSAFPICWTIGRRQAATTWSSLAV